MTLPVSRVPVSEGAPGGFRGVDITGTVQHPVTVADELLNLSLIVLVRESTP